MEMTYHVSIHRFVISRLAAMGIEPEAFSREIGLNGMADLDTDRHLAAETFTRIWELAEHALSDPAVGVRVGCQYRLGSGGLHDYLFSTKATLGEGLATIGPYVSAVSTNHRLGLNLDVAGEATLDITMIDGQGRVRELTHQWGLAATVARAKEAAGTRLAPKRVCFTQRAPRDHSSFVEAFGTTAIEFEAAADSVTFYEADLGTPLATADPILSEILEPLAAAVPRLPAATWPERVAEALALALDDGEASLASVARRLTASPRTVQRRLAEAGTTWRTELDRARQVRLARVGDLPRIRQAQLLGYTDVGSMRRAARRWG